MMREFLLVTSICLFEIFSISANDLLPNVTLCHEANPLNSTNNNISTLFRINVTHLVPCDFSSSNFCYALFKFENGVAAMYSQGCSFFGVACTTRNCTSSWDNSSGRNLSMCCCQTSACNDHVQNITSGADIRGHTDWASFADHEMTSRSSLFGGDIYMVSVSVLLCGLALIITVYALRHHKVFGSIKRVLHCVVPHSSERRGGYKQRPLLCSPDSGEGIGAIAESVPLNHTHIPFEQLQLGALIGRGRYGSVHTATWRDRVVAVKLFPPWQRQYYETERRVYAAFQHSCHSSILGYHGFGETGAAQAPPPAVVRGHQAPGSEQRACDMEAHKFYLVISYAPTGNLHDYLVNHTITFNQLYRMCFTLIDGLAFLHSSSLFEYGEKPAIVHRDLNSCNILVADDRQSCLICDFGLAMNMSAVISARHSQQTATITDAGTLRYMAPEVLEGAVNLRDCEQALKHVDMYACALVLWELVSRCRHVHVHSDECPVAPSGGKVTDHCACLPPYSLPYQAELGMHASHEDMRMFVSRACRRPAFSPRLDRSLGCVRLITHIIQDSWDQDAEARLSALCARQRVSQLTALAPKHCTHSLTGDQLPETVENRVIGTGQDDANTESVICLADPSDNSAGVHQTAVSLC